MERNYTDDKKRAPFESLVGNAKGKAFSVENNIHINNENEFER